MLQRKAGPLLRGGLLAGGRESKQKVAGLRLDRTPLLRLQERREA